MNKNTLHTHSFQFYSFDYAFSLPIHLFDHLKLYA